MYKQKIRAEMLSYGYENGKRDLCKKYESIPVTCTCLIYKGRDRWDHFGELEFVLSSSCFIFFHLNMLISNMCVRTKSFSISHCQTVNNPM